MNLPARVAGLCVAAMLMYGPSVLALAQGEDDGRAAIAAGTSAFELGDYRRALELFEAAQRTGPPSASLAYNVGVTQYKLGEHAAAAATFARLAEDFPAMRSIAVYNR